MSDDATCFTADELKTFIRSILTKWRKLVAYAPMLNGRAEQMVGIVKDTIGRLVVYRKE